MTCVCKLAGYCERHRIDKTQHLFKRCQDGTFFDAWEAGRGPGQQVEAKATDSQIAERRRLVKELGRKAWDKLFSEVTTAEELQLWEKTIPKYGCDCTQFYAMFKRDNPPGDVVLFEWKWRLKTAVNAKLCKPNLSLEDARKLYGQ